MSANIELALLTRVAETGDFHSLAKAGINESYFFTPEAREVFRSLNETYHSPATAGQVPTIDLVRYRFPTLQLSSPPDTVPILAEQLRQEKLRIELLQLAQMINDRAGLDTAACIAELRQKSVEIASMHEPGEDLSMSSVYDMIRSEYELVQNTHGMLGIPYPWQVLNDELQGMQPSQFIVLFGRPKSMKTWIAIYMAAHAYIHSRRRVLFYTREMHPKQIAKRVACAIARVDYKQFISGRLQPELRQRVFTILAELRDDETAAGTYAGHQPCFRITTDRGRSGRGSGGVAWLQAKIREVQPHIVFVDGMYLMKDDRSNQRTIDWKQVAHISQDLKLTCQEFEIPLIGITQANRAADKSKGEDLTELSFSDSLGQDADAVFRVSRVVRIDESGQKRTELYMTAPGLREGTFEGMVLNGQPATNFEYIRTMVAEDAEAAYGDRRGGQQRSGGGPRPQGDRTSAFRRPPTDPRINNSHMR
jgi:replicative DNA helicase